MISNKSQKKAKKKNITHSLKVLYRTILTSCYSLRGLINHGPLQLCCADCCLVCFPPRYQLTQFVCWHTVQLCKSVEKMLTLFVWALFPLAEILMHDEPLCVLNISYLLRIHTQYQVPTQITHTDNLTLLSAAKISKNSKYKCPLFQRIGQLAVWSLRGHPNTIFG